VTAAWVNGSGLAVSEVDERERAVRDGRASVALPVRDSSEGRQLRRWLVQLMVAERLVDGEDAGDHPPALKEIAADGAAMLELGSVAAALLSQSPRARAVFRKVTAHVMVRPEQVARYYEANPEQFGIAEQRGVRHAILPDPEHDPGLADRPVRTLRRGELTGAVEDAVFAAGQGATVGPVRDPLGWHVLRVESLTHQGVRPLAEVRDEIEARLLGIARRRAFTAWLDGRIAEAVRLEPGYEHPGDPGQPDNTHRH
jgi:[acyl-carrier-protein] S-malonyltransferase